MDKFHMEFGGLASTNSQYFTTNKTSLNKTAEKAAEMLPWAGPSRYRFLPLRITPNPDHDMNTWEKNLNELANGFVKRKCIMAQLQ